MDLAGLKIAQGFAMNVPEKIIKEEHLMKKFLAGWLFSLLSMGSFAGPILSAGDSALFEFDLGYEPGFFSEWLFVTGVRNWNVPINTPRPTTSVEFFANLDGTGSWFKLENFSGSVGIMASSRLGDGTLSARITMGEWSGTESPSAEVSPYLVDLNDLDRPTYSASAVTVTRAASEVSAPGTIGLLGLGLACIFYARRKKA